MERARRRLRGQPAPGERRRRSDRGVSRLDPAVLECVATALSGHQRPRMREMLAEIGKCCREKGLEPPSRATIYKLMIALPGPTWRVGELPRSVQAALYNLTPSTEVPARQLAFYCFNYGDLRAMSFAAGLPWLALYQAVRQPGYRKKSRGLAGAAAKARGI